MNIKIFEKFNKKYPATQFKDNYLEVHKITEGANKGKVVFKFYDNYNEIKSLTSLPFGCAKILDSKYEHNEEIRNVILDVSRFKKVQSNTIEMVLYEFLFDMGYKQESDLSSGIKMFDRDVINDLVSNFSDEIKSVVELSNNIGDVLDGFKKIRNEVFKYQKRHYDEWTLNKDVNKYNL